MREGLFFTLHPLSSQLHSCKIITTLSLSCFDKVQNCSRSVVLKIASLSLLYRYFHDIYSDGLHIFCIFSLGFIRVRLDQQMEYCYHIWSGADQSALCCFDKIQNCSRRYFYGKILILSWNSTV